MCSQRKITLLLSVVLQLCIPALAGDCYDNNENYDNCNTCYQTFVNALVNTGDNKYKLSKLFFPIDDIQVEITYNSTSNATEPRVWYWIKDFMSFKLFSCLSFIHSSWQLRHGASPLVLFFQTTVLLKTIKQTATKLFFSMPLKG